MSRRNGPGRWWVVPVTERTVVGSHDYWDVFVDNVKIERCYSLWSAKSTAREVSRGVRRGRIRLKACDG